MSSALEQAAETLERRKIAALGLDPQGDVPEVVWGLPVAMLLGTDVQPEEFATYCERVTRRMIETGLSTFPLPGLVSSAWCEGFLLGVCAGQLSGERST